ncbi:MAG: STAS domain-containing protein [Anaerolineales bacterium]
MTIRIASLDPSVWTVTLDGRVDLPAARALEDALNELCDAGRARIVVDLSNVPYMASAGLKALLSGLRRARLLGGEVRLAGLVERVREVFEMSGFDQVFAIFPSLAGAVGSYSVTQA